MSVANALLAVFIVATVAILAGALKAYLESE